MRCGFTLPEVLVSVVILATGIVAILQAFNVSLSVLGESRSILKGNMLIMQKMAEVELASITLGDIETGTTSGSFDRENNNYQWQIKAEKISGGFEPASGSGTLNQVEISVWREGSQREYKASTYLKTVKKQ